jgi:diguanylate cyclase (GGDEF)-like protein
MWAVGEPPADEGQWGYPPHRPFILLAIYFVIGTAQLALTVLDPPLPDTNVALNAVLAVVSMSQAVATALAGVFLAARALAPIVASGILVAAVSAAGAAGGQGQLVAGLYLAVLGLFSGYFLSVRAVRMLLVLSTVTFGAALAFNLKLDSVAYILGLVVLVIGVTLVVSSLVQHLRGEAVRDPLTGALNRRGLQLAAQAIHHMDARRWDDTVVVEIDLDGFKAYNDRHGHQAGDVLLASLVADWSTVLRRSDIVTRTGGDEFVLLLPGTSADEAEVLVDRLRAVNPFPFSAGVTTWVPGETLPVALQHADEAMYQEKSRNPGSR